MRYFYLYPVRLFVYARLTCAAAVAAAAAAAAAD